MGTPADSQKNLLMSERPPLSGTTRRPTTQVNSAMQIYWPPPPTPASSPTSWVPPTLASSPSSWVQLAHGPSRTVALHQANTKLSNHCANAIFLATF